MIHSIEYWKEYNESSFDDFGPDDNLYNTDFMETLNYGLFKWNQEADEPIYNISLYMLEEAYEFFNINGGISANIIKAMICQLC